jgi:hypothetical protein
MQNNNLECEIKPKVSIMQTDKSFAQLKDIENRQQIQLTGAAIQVLCPGCFNTVEVKSTFRCYHCRLFYCERCAKTHFKDEGINLKKETCFKLLAIFLEFSGKVVFTELFNKVLIVALRTVNKTDMEKEFPKYVADLKNKPRPMWMFQMFGVYALLLPPEEIVCKVPFSEPL